PGGEALASIGAPATRPAVLLFKPRRTATYRLIASTTHKRQTGAYTLTVERLAPTLTETATLKSTDPQPTAPAECRRKELTRPVDAGKTYLLQAEAGGAEVAVRVRGGAGKSDKSPDADPTADSPRVAFTPARTGEHRIVVLGKQVGPFTVTVHP